MLIIIVWVIKSDDDLQECLQYELAPMPLSLFDDVSMKKTQKAVMFDIIESATCKPNAQYPQENVAFVIDGGFLLWKLTWSPSVKYYHLYTMYIELIRRQYRSSNVTVIFDGYNDKQCTKNMERKRRALKCMSADINFTDDMMTTVSQS